MANASQHGLYLIPEVTYGTTPPTTPAFSPVRHTSTSLGLSKDSILAQELRADRQISDYQTGVKQVGGDIVTEVANDSQFDALLESALGTAFTADVLDNGVVRKPFSIIRDFSDITTGRYLLMTGCEVNTLTLQTTANDRAQATFGLIGKGLTVSDTPPTGAIFGTPSVTPIMTGVQGAIDEGGGASTVVTEFSVTLENGIEIKPIIGSDETLEPSIGRANVTGSITAYFESGTLLSKFVDDTSSSLSLTMTDGTNTYTVEVPNIRYSGGDAPASGQGAITVTLPFQAIYDSVTSSTTMRIVRS